MNIDNQLTLEATAFINESFCTLQNFELPFGIVNKLKAISNHYRGAAGQTALPTTSSCNMDQVNQVIQRRVIKWRSALTVEFEKLFPNMLNGSMIVIDEQSFVAKCPICQIFYSVVEPGRNFSLYKRNFIDHLKYVHLNINRPLRHSQHNLRPIPNINSTQSEIPDLTLQTIPTTIDNHVPVETLPVRTRRLRHARSSVTPLSTRLRSQR